MPCYNPLPAWLTPDGIRVCPSGKVYTDLPPTHKVPCGQCIGCLADRAKSWGVRIMQESTLHEVSCFATLTYRDECIPIVNGRQTLDKSHLQLFFKRLRKYLHPKKIRYFGCGEYGSQTLRPHYHFVIFGYWPKDAEYVKKSDSGAKLFRSDCLDNLWSKGFCDFGSVTMASATYCAKYVVKSLDRKNVFEGVVKPFALMSRRPGIGAVWFDQNVDQLWTHGKCIVEGKQISIPRFYLKKMKSDSRFRDLQRRRIAFIELDEYTPERLDVKKTIAEKNVKLFDKNTI